MNAGVFEKYALNVADIIFEKHPVAVMVGGTGLYIKAFEEGMDEIPAVDAALRELIIDEYEVNGLEYLQNEVAEKDPAFWQTGERQNPQRLMRALEVVLSTGKSITTFRKGKKEQRSFKVIKIGLELPRQQLYNQINQRVDIMIEQGLPDEVESLKQYQNLNALQTVGYKELFAYFDGAVSLEEAVTNIKTNTRHYAKRQLTWFKKDENISWINPQNADAFSAVLEKLSAAP